MQTDPLADFLTQIRNANTAGKTNIKTAYSRLRGDVADVLKKEGYLEDVSLEKDKETGRQVLALKLKRVKREQVIRGIRRVSRPGLRRYVGSKDIPRVLGGLGIAVLSTSKGVMSGHSAKKQNVGGEILAYVW